MALVQRTRRSLQTLRGRVHEARRQDLGPQRQMVGGRWRRHHVGQHDLRCRTQHHVRGHGQWIALVTQGAQPQGRRQPVPGLHRGPGSRHRQIQVALSGNTGRQLGLHLHPAHDPGRHQDRRQAAQGHTACAQERLLLRARPHQWKVHLGQELRARELGQRLRQARQAHRHCRSARRQQAPGRGAGPLWRAQLAPHVLQPPDGPGVSACAERARQPDGRQEMGVQPGRTGQAPVGHRLEHGQVLQCRAAQEQALWPSAGLGPRCAKGSLERGACLALERRHADHGGQCGVPGNG